MAFKTKEELERLRNSDPADEYKMPLPSKDERLARIFQTCEGVWASFEINDWEKNFLQSLKEQTYKLTPRQDQKLREIEEKIVQVEKAERKGAEVDELTGELKFKRR